MVSNELKVPRVMVLMPVYNGEKYLRVALKSILRQTFRDFEFLIILEPSSDRSEAIIKSIHDPRITLVQNPVKLGLSKVLNQGMDMARGEYIARMDCDDIALPQRLMLQVKYLDRHRDVDICGTWAINLLPSSGKSLRNIIERVLSVLGLFEIATSRPPHAHKGIKVFSIFNAPFNHPTVMMRVNPLRKYNLHYATNLQFAEDYDFWLRMIDLCKGVNLRKYLYYYRIHASQFGTTFKQQQHEGTSHVRSQSIQKIGFIPSPEEMRIHDIVSDPMTAISAEDLLATSKWFNKLLQANQKVQYYPEQEFSRMLAEKWARACGHTKAPPLWLWRIFWRSPLQPALKLGIRNFVKLLIWLMRRKLGFSECASRLKGRLKRTTSV